MMTKALVTNGATVYILGRRREVLDEAVHCVKHAGVVKPLVCDVTSKQSLKAAVDAITAEIGYINLLICNAGVAGPQVHQSPLDDEVSVEEFAQSHWKIAFEDYSQVFEVNTVAIWYTSIAFLQLLNAGNKQGNVTQKSQIIATTSIAGFNKASGPNDYRFRASYLQRDKRSTPQVLPTANRRLRAHI